MQPVAFIDLIIDSDVSGTLNLAYNSPQTINIGNVGVSLVGGNLHKIPPDISIKSVGNIVPSVTADGYAGITGTIRMGLEMTVDVNGIPLTLDPRFDVYVDAIQEVMKFDGICVCLQ